MDIHDLSLFHRMLCSLSPRIRMWWGNTPMFSSTRVGWSGLSCFSLAICGPGAYSCREGPITRAARTTSKSNSCSTAPSSPWTCQGAALWKLWACRGCTRPGARALDAPVPMFLVGNYTPTIPHQLYQHRSTRFPHELAGAADESGRKGGRKGSNVTCQRVRDQQIAVAVWARQTASGGPVGG